MKESEFIELLNLYVDHEISAEDAARLESEVAANPGRRRVYSQYCQIHKACSLLGGQFQETVAPVGWSEPENRGWGWMTTAAAAGLMAAACFAAVIALRPRVSAPSPGATAAPALALQAPAARPDRTAVPVASSIVELQPVFAMSSLGLDGDSPASVTLASANPENDPFAWMNGVQMEPVSRVPIDQFFRGSPALLQQPSRAARPASSLQAPVEMAAFRFQR